MKKTPWIPVWIMVAVVLACFLAVRWVWPPEVRQPGGEEVPKSQQTKPGGSGAAGSAGMTAPAPSPENTVPDTAMNRRRAMQIRPEAEPIGPVLPERMNEDNGDKTAYLTFDDGPSANTGKILDILRRYGVKATFFVVGRESEEAVRLYRRIVEDGHQLGNHTYSHDYRTIYSSADAYLADTEKLNRLLEETAGIRPKIVRFPAGSNHRLGGAKRDRTLMPAIIRRLEREGYRYYDWNVSSTDAAQAVQPKDEIVGAVLDSSQDKRQAVIIMHDANVKTTTVEALPEVIRGLRAQGFRFKTLDDRTAFAPQFLRP